MSIEGSWLRGKTALITGGARRLGRASALSLAAAGANVIIHYRRSAQQAEETAEQAREQGVRAWTIQADLGEEEEAGALFYRAQQECAPIAVLLNNASIFPERRLLEVQSADIEENVQLHVMAPLFLSRALASQNRPGRIINFLDSRIQDYDRLHVAYHLSKRMLFSLTRMMALEFAPALTVNAIAPGLILPPPGKDEAYLQSLVHSNPLQKHGSARDITRALLFLLESDFITGQVLFVDGGRHIKGCVYG